jgi:CxC6 like cysteine cluster associated with KDZ transposases
MYDLALTRGNEGLMEQGGWKFGTRLTTEHVWDAFVILSLLKDHQRRNVRLVVPHTGDQKDRFTSAMVLRNERIVLNGQDELTHSCDKCMRIYHNADGTMSKCQPIITDGLTLGHPCCGVFRCTEPLQNNRNRFCATHFARHWVCAIDGCEQPCISAEAKTCANPAHRQMEHLNKARGQAAFILKQRLLHHKVSHPNDAMGTELPERVTDLEENVEWFEINDDNAVNAFHAPNQGSVGVADSFGDEEILCESRKSESGNRKVKAQFGRRRTHNEQTLVRPCGVIIARATFFGAEAVSNVLFFVKKVFSVPGAEKPEHLIYDTNCDAKQQVLAQGDTYFDDIGMCVDVWHFLNKHKVSHTFCQAHCNPADYPELMTPEGKWFFNTSIAEQTNVWLGGYHAMCREMLPVKYNFFLDEMIRLKNEVVVEKLRRGGHHPRHYPIATA